jgi:hypothetical protein
VAVQTPSDTTESDPTIMAADNATMAVDTPDEEKVPVSHMVKERKKTQALEARIKQFEQEKMSEVERLQAERDEARAEAEAERTKSLNAERSGLVRAAASKVKFADPEDAVAFADLSEIDDKAAAERFVKSLANRKPHLIAKEQAPGELQRVLRDGLPTDGSPVQQSTEQDARLLQGREILELAQAARARTQR